jgi:hypothetical protein
MAFSGSRFFAMQNPQHRSLIAQALALVALLLGVQAAPAVDKYPDFLPSQYQRYFARFVDNRTLPERMLNAVSITSQEYGRGFALIAGIAKYPFMSGAGRDLEPAGEDIRKLANYLTEFEKLDEIVVLKDADVTEANLSFFCSDISRADSSNSHARGSCLHIAATAPRSTTWGTSLRRKHTISLTPSTASQWPRCARCSSRSWILDFTSWR